MSSATSPLLSIPRKTTSEVDYASAIKQVISTTYGEPPDRYAEEISTLNRARQDAVRGAAGSDLTARDLLYRYFGQLELLELRFPDLRVPFPWNDAFTPSKNISQLSLAYEKASVIFNIAATLSALAAAQNRSSPEGIKRAFNFYRSSAGMFTYINDNFLHAPSTDLGRDLIKILVTLMSAHATEVFLERMNEEKRSPGLKSKICAQVAALYTSVIEDIKENVGKGYFDRSWLVLAQVKGKYFSALAQYNRALADTTSSKYGEALCRLNVADTTVKEAVRLSLTYGTSFYINPAASASSTLPADAGPSLQEMCKSLATIIAETKTATLKDNDLIYHSIVPSEASLSAIEKAANVAEPIPIQEIYASPDVQKLVGPDIFIKLVPLSVIESSSLYSEEKAKILRTEGERCDLADGEMLAAIEHLGLPGSLSKFQATGASGSGDQMATIADPGGQVRAWSREIRDAESSQRTEAFISELVRLRDKTNADLDYCSRELDMEQRECEQARVKYDHLFEQSPSAGHTRSWRTDVKNDREALLQAQASDHQVLSLWTSVRDDVNTLGAGEEVVEGVFLEAINKAQQSSGAGGARDLLDLDLPDEEGEEMKKRIAHIEENLSRLNKLKQERTDVLNDLKERVHNDDISQLLILNRKSQNVEPTLFAAELEKFRPHQARIQATIALQQSTIQQVQNVYSQLSTGKKGKEIQDRFTKVERVKKDLVARFKRAHDAYREIRTGVTKGSDFYRELSEVVTSIRGEVSQFVSARANERSQMLANAEQKQQRTSSSGAYSNGLDKSFDSLSLGGQSSAYEGSSRTPQPQSPTRSTYSGSAYPSIPSAIPQGQARPTQPPAQTSYQPYSNPTSARPLSVSSGYSSGSNYPHSATPSLPPKPSSGAPPYRQPSMSGLPAPPSQPQYAYQSQQTHSMPPPPSNLSYSSSSYSSPPASQSRPMPPPPQPSSYASPPPPPQHPSHTGYGGPAARPPPAPPSSQPSYTSQPSYGWQQSHDSQPSYGASSSPYYRYSQAPPPGQSPYTPTPPPSQQGNYGQQQYSQQQGYQPQQHSQPPPPPPQQQYGQYGQQGQYQYQPRY